MIFLVLIEVVTLNITTTWFAFGSLIAFIFSLLKTPSWFQFTIFFISSIILLLFAKPILTKKLKVGKNKTNTDTLIGKTGLVIKPIKPFSYRQVKVKGTIWTAKSEEH